MRRVDAEKLYYALEFFLSTPTWVVTSLYLVSVLHLSPLQLVLMGTAMEAAVFLCEIPTGHRRGHVQPPAVARHRLPRHGHLVAARRRHRLARRR